MPIRIWRFITTRDFLVAAIVVVLSTPFFWMLLDRTPPYIRISGEILPADPENCALAGAPKGGIYPGSCVAVVWKIHPTRICPPSTPTNIQSNIVDGANIRWPIEPVSGFYGTKYQQQGSEKLT